MREEGTPMKVLLINGSPNEKRCTHTALAEVAGALEAEGVETEIAWIGREAVRGCLGCGGCAKRGDARCIFDDDVVNGLIAKAEAADGLVVGTPVYYAGANGALLAVLDRMFYAGASGFAHKPAACIVSARRAGTTASVDVINKYFTISQMPVVSSTYWPMVHGSTPEEVAQDAEGLQTVRNLARNMAWLIKCIKESGIEPPKPDRGARTNFIR